MILFGPLAPKFIADTFVASENVGEGGPGDIVRLLELKENTLRRDRGRLGAMVVVVEDAAECEGNGAKLPPKVTTAVHVYHLDIYALTSKMQKL